MSQRDIRLSRGVSMVSDSVDRAGMSSEQDAIEMTQRSRSEDQAIHTDFGGVNPTLGSIGRILLA